VAEAFIDGGLAGLEEAPRPGLPSTIDPAKAHRAITEVVQPPKNRARWSTRTMARELSLSKNTVQRLWQANDLKPHRIRLFKLSHDQDFVGKFWDVVGLYLDPPTKAVVLCCDEKSQCQALERSHPGLPLGQGEIATRTHDYYRHGTIPLFPALNYLNGKIIAQRAARHRQQEWLAFLKQIDGEVPAYADIHLILDNYATHKHPKVKSWLAKHPRFHLHFTPTSASWMNLVERFFRDLSQDVILPGSFASVEDLTARIWASLEERNLRPTRYVWQAKGHDILEKIQRGQFADKRLASVRRTRSALRSYPLQLTRRKLRAPPRAIRRLRRYIHNPRLRRIRRRQNRQKHQPLVKRIVRPMHLPHRDKRHLSRPEDAMRIPHPLFRAPGDDIDEFLPRRMRVKRMAAVRLHVRAHQQKLLVLHHIAPAQPFLQRPRGDKIHFFSGGDETAKIDIAHGGEC
jgi:transposase